MPTPHHLLVPYAACRAPAAQDALKKLALPHLDQLLARLQPLEPTPQPAGDDSPDLPHETALARAMGLPDAPGRIPWAAWHRQQQGEPRDGSAWAFFTPCHWQVGTDHITLQDPQALQLDEADSRALLAIVAPWFAQDGIELHYDQPGRWLARGDWLADLSTPSLERVQGSDVRAWLQHSAAEPHASAAARQAARTLQRLHSEMQMLLYTHAFNDKRSAQGLPPINAVWVHGAGRLPPDAASHPPPEMPLALRDAALRGDWAAWAAAWVALDAGPLAELAAHANQGSAVQLTLCGERSARTWHSAPRSLRQRLQGFFRPSGRSSLPEQL